MKVDDHGLPGLSAITCPHTTLAAGASQTCTATYLTTAADVDAGSVTNTATAQGDPPTGPHVVSAPSSATITAIQSPAITVVKSASPSTFSVAGETINYSFDVTNSGNVTLTSVKVDDHGLPGLSAITCPHTTLAAGASQTCTATYLTTAADVDAGSVTNTATAQGDPPTGPHVVSAPSSATITAIQSPAITVVKSASPSTFSVAGETINYSFDVTNSGNVTLTSVKVDDHGLPGLSAITCPHTTLAAGASQTCTATYLTTAADVDAGSVTNTATAKGDPPTGPHVVSAPSSATITAIQSPAITVVKSASPSTFSVAGETINYSFDVTNSGNVTLTQSRSTTPACPACPPSPARTRPWRPARPRPAPPPTSPPPPTWTPDRSPTPPPPRGTRPPARTSSPPPPRRPSRPSSRPPSPWSSRRLQHVLGRRADDQLQLRRHQLR